MEMRKNMELFITIILLFVFFKLTGLVFGIFGRALGIVFGLLGHVFIGVLAVLGFGMAIFILPVAVVAGIIAIIAHLIPAL